MILVDANIFMYAAGGSDPHKDPSIEFLNAVATHRIEAAIDAETLREILQRYVSIGRWREGRIVYDQARALMPLVVPITATVMDRARGIVDSKSNLRARDAIHAAVCQLEDAECVCSYDRDFDRVPALERREPEQLLGQLS